MDNGVRGIGFLLELVNPLGPVQESYSESAGVPPAAISIAPVASQSTIYWFGLLGLPLILVVQ
jgi:hypothetical protein